MIPYETSGGPGDDGLLEQVIACDALLHSAPTLDRAAPVALPASDANDRGRDRLLLLLTLLNAADTVSRAGEPDQPGAGPERPAALRKQPLLGRFDVIEEIGSGGFGFVVRARDLRLGRDVALKFPLPERVLGPGDLRRFLKEARAAARLDHPHIVRVFDAAELGPVGYYIASEYCAGPSLRQWLRSQPEPVPATRAARWLASLADAVQHAHERGILHRDIKSDNVILSAGAAPGEFIPRLTDFGLAKLLEEPGDETRSGARLGTPHYMSPEQAAGRNAEVGPATDVYGLGATLYELLTGRPPFRGENDTGTLRLVLEAEPVAPRTLRPGLPRDLETICLKSLRKKPARRYASAAALRDDLERFLAGQPIAGRPPSAWEQARGLARRRPAYTAVLAMTVLMVLATLGAALTWTGWLQWHNRLLEAEVERADRQTQEARKQARIAGEQAALAESHLHAESLRRAQQAMQAQQIELAQDILHDDENGSTGGFRRGFGWHYLWQLATREIRQLWGHQGRVQGSAVSPDGRFVASVDRSGNVFVWNRVEDAGLDRPDASFSAPFPVHNLLEFSGDGRFLAVGLIHGTGPSGGVTLFDRASGRCLVRVRLRPAKTSPRPLLTIAISASWPSFMGRPGSVCGLTTRAIPAPHRGSARSVRRPSRRSSHQMPGSLPFRTGPALPWPTPKREALWFSLRIRPRSRSWP